MRSLAIDEPFVRGGSEYYLTDALGSTVVLTDATGLATTSYSYEPFGTSTLIGAPTGNSLEFTGRENDGTGLRYYRARYYHSGLCRFIAEDPLGLQRSGTSLYAYVFDNPTSFTDPFGLYTVVELAGILYNETATLSGCSLLEARIAMAHVAINREAVNDRTPIAPTTLRPSEQEAIRRGYRPAADAWAQSVTAAALALSEQMKPEPVDPTGGALHFLLDWGQGRPTWGRGYGVLAYGPCISGAGSQFPPGFRPGDPVTIRIFP